MGANDESPRKEFRKKLSEFSRRDDFSDEEIVQLEEIFPPVLAIFLDDLNLESEIFAPLHLRYLRFQLERQKAFLRRSSLRRFLNLRDTGLNFNDELDHVRDILRGLSDHQLKLIEKKTSTQLADVFDETQKVIESLIEKADPVFHSTWKTLYGLPRLEQDLLVALYADQYWFSSRLYACKDTRTDSSLKHLVHILSTIHRREDVLKATASNSPLFLHGLIEIDIKTMSESRMWLDVKPNANIPEQSNGTKPTISRFEWLKSITPSATLDQVFLDETKMRHIRHLVQDYKENVANGNPTRLTFLFHGGPGLGKTLLSDAIATELEQKILRVQLGNLNQDLLPDIISYVISRAQSANQVLLFEECERLLWTSHSFAVSSSWMKLLFEDRDFAGCAIFTTNYPVGQDFQRRITYPVKFEAPSALVRSRILSQELSRLPAEAVDVDPSAKERVVKKYPVPAGFMQQSLQLARSLGKGKIRNAELDEAFQAIHETLGSNHDKIQEPRTGLPLCLEPEVGKTFSQLKDFAKRKIRGEDLPFRGGITALFWGLPGTGKTMAAETLAAELGVNWMKITASDILSKWVGETEQRIREVFETARRQKALLFIDEAEGLLLTREGAEHSWERTRMNEFLRVIEDFDGVLVCATNLREHLDPALFRRFLYQIRFDTPSPQVRCELWQNWNKVLHLSETEIEQLAERFDLTGGEIQNIAKKSYAEGSPDFARIQILCEEIQVSRWGSSTKRIGIR